MAKIKGVKQFKERVDAAFETQKTRDEAKACYDFQREEYKAQEEELCAYAAANPDVSEGRDGACGAGARPRGHRQPEAQGQGGIGAKRNEQVIGNSE